MPLRFLIRISIKYLLRLNKFIQQNDRSYHLLFIIIYYDLLFAIYIYY